MVKKLCLPIACLIPFGLFSMVKTKKKELADAEQHAEKSTDEFLETLTQLEDLSQMRTVAAEKLGSMLDRVQRKRNNMLLQQEERLASLLRAVRFQEIHPMHAYMQALLVIGKY